MTTLHLVTLAFFIIAAACFLLVIFGVEAAGSVALQPLGLFCFVIGVALHHHHVHPHGA